VIARWRQLIIRSESQQPMRKTISYKMNLAWQRDDKCLCSLGGTSTCINPSMRRLSGCSFVPTVCYALLSANSLFAGCIGRWSVNASSAGRPKRPTLLFVAAYALNITPHEAVHALNSYQPR
jgi:hypothetical protein